MGATMTVDSLALKDMDITGLRILVVEDCDDCASTTAILLRMDGHDVHIAEDAAAGLEALDSQSPDVVLIDVGLPGMDGWQLAKRIRERTRDREPFLIAITGYGAEEDQRRSEEAGIDLHLLKPVDPAMLRQLLKRFQRIVGD